MSIKFSLQSSGRVILAAGTAICGLVGAANAADLPVTHRHASYAPESRKQVESASATADMTGSIGTRATVPSGAAPVGSAADHILEVRVQFLKTRALMESAIRLRERSARIDASALAAQFNALYAGLAAVEHTHQAGAPDLVKTTVNLTQAWQREGMKIINPPAEGLLELPLPMSVARKADAAAHAIDQMIEKASVAAHVPQPIRLTQKRPVRVLQSPKVGQPPEGPFAAFR